MFIYEAQKLLREKKITPSILLKESIEKIEEWKRLGAFITTNIDQVLELAASKIKYWNQSTTICPLYLEFRLL